MANSQSLQTGVSSGSQATTQNPQSVPQTTGYSGGAPSSAVQPGTADSILTNVGGIPLQTAQLSTVSLATTTTTASTSQSVDTHRNFNPVLMGFAVLLVIVAIYLFWTTSHSAKNTTK